MRLCLSRRWRRLALALCCVATPHTVRAAEPEVLFEDNFATYSPDLGNAGPGTDVKDNALHVAIPVGSWNRKLYKSKRFTDADVTMRVRIPNFTVDEGNEVGLAFWGVDYEDFYSLTIADWGGCGCFHYRRGQFRQPVVFRKVDGLKTAPGEWNDLRVVTQGNLATLYVNGQQLAVVKGRPPQEGGLVGTYCYPGSKPLTAEYAALKVVRPTGKPPLTLAADADDVIYAMDATFADPAWTTSTDAFGWKDGGLFLLNSINTTDLRLYMADGAAAMDVAAKVRLIDGDEASGVGLIFWAKNKNDFFSFYVSADGKVQASHYADKKFTTHLRTPVPAEAKMNVRDWTALHIVTEKGKANFFVNDVKVGMIFETSPVPESQFGIMCDGGGAPSRGEFRELKAKRLTAVQTAK